MIELILSTIAPYGQARVYPRFSQRFGYEWTIEGELDLTFEFLLAEKSIPPNDEAPRRVVFAYLAGLFDAEGSVWPWDGRAFAPRLSFTNKDTLMLDRIEQQMKRFGFHPKRGAPDRNGVSRTLLWRNREIVEFLQSMPLRHPEKKAKTRLLIGPGSRADDLSYRWEGLLAEIESDRLDSIALAKLEIEAS